MLLKFFFKYYSMEHTNSNISSYFSLFSSDTIATGSLKIFSNSFLYVCPQNIYIFTIWTAVLIYI